MIYAFFDVVKARRKFFCSESKGSLTKLPLQVKFETKARILAMRLAREAAGDLTNKKIFFLSFYLLKRLTFTKYSLATSSAGLPFAPTSKFIWLISSSEIFPAN